MALPPRPVVVVLGAGLSGLAAADALCSTPPQHRPHVILLDPSARAGGVVESIRRDGWLAERSADNVLAARPEALAVIERLGLSGELMAVREGARRALVWREGKTLPVPAGFRLLAPGTPAGIRETDILSAEGKARVLAERDVPPRAGDDDESLESFAVRRLGREAFDRLVQPLVAGIWTADPAKLSMAAACPEFLSMEREHGSLSVGEETRLARMGESHRGEGARYGQFVTLASGMGRLAERWQERLRTSGVEWRCGRATAVSRDAAGRFRVEAVGAEGEPQAIAADGVVVALPAPIAAGVVAPLDAGVAGELAAIEYAGSVVVVLGWPRQAVAHPLDAAGLVVPRIEGRAALAISFSSSKFPGRAPEGQVLLRVFLGGALDPERTLLDDDRLVALATREAADLLGARGVPSFVEIARWPGAMPQYHLGHGARLARIDRGVASFPGLALAGAAYGGVGIPQVIGSGTAAAARILERIGTLGARPG